MARNVYTVRVVEANDVDFVEVEAVPFGHQYIISHMNATSNPLSTNWSSFNNPIQIANATTANTIWAVSPIPDVALTLRWEGRYVLEFGDQLVIAAVGWDVAVTAYDLTLP